MIVVNNRFSKKNYIILVNRTFRISILLLVFQLLVMFSFSAAAEKNRLAPGDKISITVYGESDLSINNIRISESGTISYPLIGSLSLLGKLPIEIEREIVSKLKNGFLKRPRVSVAIQQYRPFFVNGQVGSPGAFPYVDGLTIRKAFAIAGGLTDKASNNKIFIIKESNRTEEIQVKDWNDEMQPGDILTVGESLF